MARNFVRTSSQKASTDTVPVTVLPFSFACWFRCTSTPPNSSGYTLLSLSGATTETWIRAYYTTTFGRKLQVMYETSVRGEADADWSENTWHHAALTVADSNTRVLRLDNSAYNNYLGGIAINLSGTFTVGFSPSGLYQNGDIAEVSVWNVSLSDAEVAMLSKGYAAPFVRPEALTFYAPLWGRHDPEAELTARNTLTLANSPTVSSHPPMRGLRRLGRFDDSSAVMLMGHYLAYSGGTLL